MFSNNPLILTTAFSAIALIGTASSHAAFVGLDGPGDEDATGAISIVSHSGQADVGRGIINTINGSGMTGNQDVGGNPYWNFALFRNPTGPNPGTVAGSHWVVYQFDQVYSLANVHIWNWNEIPYTGFGWKNLVIQTSLDGTTWSTAYTGIIAESEGTNPSNVDLIAPVGNVDALYVLLINSGIGTEENWSNGAYANDGGLSEVRFETVVPEPAALSLIGVAAAALMGRRRR